MAARATNSWNGFKGAAKRIEDVDLPRIGSRIGVGEDEIHALMDVEAAGAGFDKLGRPKMLFEPHIFYRNLSGPKREQAVKAGLAYENWKRSGYPKDSYPRLMQAMEIDETAALQAASWGLSQLLGTNFATAGYANIQAMVRAFMDDEENHLDALVSFCIKSGIDDDLRAHRWLEVARVYNGPGKAAHYAAELAKAYARWRKIPDTPWNPADTKSVLAKAPTKEVIESVQRLLRDKGFPEVGEVDGKIGNRTRTAIESFQSYAKLPKTGAISDELIAALVKYPGRPEDPSRAAATAKDLKGNEPVDNAQTVKQVGVAVTGASGLGALVEGLDLDGWLDGATKFKSLSDAVFSISPWLLGLAAGCAAIYFGSKIVRAQVRAYREGQLV